MADAPNHCFPKRAQGIKQSNSLKVALMQDGPNFRFPRHPTDPPLTELENKLFEGLEANAEKLIDATDFGRATAKMAVELVAGYLLERGLSGQALKPLINLANGLDDVNRGILPEIFDPNAERTAGAEGEREWSRSSAVQQTRIYAAACMTALMAHGKEKADAASRVADRAQTWPRHSSGIIKAITVINWRDELMQAASTDIQRRQYEGHVAAFANGERGKAFLNEVLALGPLLTGGTRRPKT